MKGEALNESGRTLISFCIPTYKRADLVKRCVMSILEIDSPEIEVVVVDNDSPDDTEEIINSIKDDRINYYRNRTNLGAVMNIIETIKKARGEWVFFLSDEDTVEKDSIKEIIANLSTGDYSDIAVMLGNVRNYDGSYYYRYKNAKYSRGDEAICNVGFTHHYMSGVMINKRHIIAKQLEGYTPSDGMYPHINLLTRACVQGGAITVDKDVCTAGCYEGRKSFVEKPNNEFYFQPNNRFEQFKVFSKIANDSIENPDLRIRMLERIFFHYLEAATYSWENVIKTASVRNHFGVEEKIRFDFSAEVKKFHSKATEYYEEIISDPDFRKSLEGSISDKMFRFKLRRMLVPMPDSFKRIARPVYHKIRDLMAD
jgi:glycosyltransferase involved in cell wall biosynthesis